MSVIQKVWNCRDLKNIILDYKQQMENAQRYNICKLIIEKTIKNQIENIYERLKLDDGTMCLYFHMKLIKNHIERYEVLSIMLNYCKENNVKIYMIFYYMFIT